MTDEKSGRGYLFASLLLFGVLLLLIVLTFRSYGISWDEGTHQRVGELTLRYYTGLLRGAPDLTVLEYGNPVAYGGAFNFFVALTQHFSPLDRFETRHLVNALVGLLGLLGCWRAARLVGGARAAFWSVLLLACTPGYYSHMYFNPKDIPFAAGMIWALYFILVAMGEFPHIRLSTLLLLGMSTGLTMGVRAGGVLLLVYLTLALSAEFWIFLQVGGFGRWRVLLRRVLSPILAVGGMAYAVMLAFWPWAHQAPLLNPLLSFLGQQRIEYEGLVLYRGGLYPGDGLPWDYLPGYLFVTLPEVFLLLLAAGVIFGVAALWGGRVKPLTSTHRDRWIAMLFLAVVLPLGYVIVRRPVIYDGARHFIFLLPPLACLAGLSFDRLAAWLASRIQGGAFLTHLIALALLSVPVITMARLFPYEYIYYNALVGGAAGAQGQYEMDYWGLSTSEAARSLAQYAAEREPASGVSFPVYTCAGKASAAHYYSPKLSVVPEANRAHFAILIDRSVCETEVPGETIITVERLGIVLAEVKELY